MSDRSTPLSKFGEVPVEVEVAPGEVLRPMSAGARWAQVAELAHRLQSPSSGE